MNKILFRCPVNTLSILFILSLFRLVISQILSQMNLG